MTGKSRSELCVVILLRVTVVIEKVVRIVCITVSPLHPSSVSSMVV